MVWTAVWSLAVFCCPVIRGRAFPALTLFLRPFLTPVKTGRNQRAVLCPPPCSVSLAVYSDLLLLTCFFPHVYTIQLPVFATPRHCTDRACVSSIIFPSGACACYCSKIKYYIATYLGQAQSKSPDLWLVRARGQRRGLWSQGLNFADEARALSKVVSQEEDCRTLAFPGGLRRGRAPHHVFLGWSGMRPWKKKRAPGSIERYTAPGSS